MAIPDDIRILYDTKLRLQRKSGGYPSFSGANQPSGNVGTGLPEAIGGNVGTGLIGGNVGIGGGSAEVIGELIRQYDLNAAARHTEMMKALRRQGGFLTQPFSIQDKPLLLRQSEDRTYFLIQNTGANSLFIGFGNVPTATNGLNLTSGSFAEPFQVPTNDIYILSSAGVGTTGILIFSIGN